MQGLVKHVVLPPAPRNAVATRAARKAVAISAVAQPAPKLYSPHVGAAGAWRFQAATGDARRLGMDAYRRVSRDDADACGTLVNRLV